MAINVPVFSRWDIWERAKKRNYWRKLWAAAVKNMPSASTTALEDTLHGPPAKELKQLLNYASSSTIYDNFINGAKPHLQKRQDALRKLAGPNGKFLAIANLKRLDNT